MQRNDDAPVAKSMAATDTARAQLERTRQSPKEATLFDLIERQTPAIEKALAGTIGAERFARVVTTEIKRNPRLLECDPATVLGSLMLAAQLQLEPGPLGHVYLVPFKRECQFIVGYKGMIELAGRTERVAGIGAEIVYEGDLWSGVRTTERGPKFEHVACAPDDRGSRVGVYCSWLERLGPRVLVPRVRWVWPSEVEAARKRSPAARANSGPWVTDEDSMWRKTAVRRASPWFPQSPYLARAVEVDEQAVRFDHGEVQAAEISEEAGE